MTPSATYPSRIDAWLVAIVVGIIAVALVQAVLLIPRSPGGALAVVGVALVTARIIAMLTLPCRYELHADHLLIRCGVIRQRIRYADITAVVPSRSLMAAPALSLRRVEISFRHGSQLVSPRDRETFISALRERVPALGGAPT